MARRWNRGCEVCGGRIRSRFDKRHKCNPRILQRIDAANDAATLDAEIQEVPRTYDDRLCDGFDILRQAGDG